jgi:hypothetical protein
MDNLKTGDILLFSGHTIGPMQYFSDLIKYGTHSNYSHVAMVLKDPTYFNLSLKGLYVWESGWEGKPDPQDNKIKLGVQLTPLKEVMENFKGSKIIIRTINNNNNFTDEKLKEIHEVVYNKPYDIVPRDWFEALFRKDSSPQKTNRFWCSALIGYIYTKCGIIKSDTDWSILRPSDFSLDGEKLSFINGKSLSKTETLINCQP